MLTLGDNELTTGTSTNNAALNGTGQDPVRWKVLIRYWGLFMESN
jgi:hypothetical protein